MARKQRKKIRPSKTLERIMAQFREKGLARQAVLLGANNRFHSDKLYLALLSSPRWKSEVESATGFGQTDFFHELLKVHKRHLEQEGGRWAAESDIMAAFLIGEYHESIGQFSPREHIVAPLEVSLGEYSISVDDLVRSNEMLRQAVILRDRAETLIYGDLSDHAQDNPEILHHVSIKHIRDNDHQIVSGFREDLVYQEESLEAMLHSYRSTLHSSGSGSGIIFASNIGAKCKRIADRLLPEYIKRIPKDFSLLSKAVVRRYGTDRIIQLASEISKRIKHILADDTKLSEAKSDLIKYQEGTSHERAIMYAQKNIEYQLEQPSAESRNIVLGYDDRTGTIRTPESLMGADLAEKTEVLELLEFKTKQLRDFIIGVKQILEFKWDEHDGFHDEECPFENHAGLPHIKYQAETLEQLREISSEMERLLDNVPDISDLVTPRKLRHKRTLVYEVEELPKNPLDVTFGSDSGCCIFVPENQEGLKNGQFVPHYLLDPGVRLFGVYNRRNGDAKQRMGFVMAFDTVAEDGMKILACNSVELSRRGLRGGNDTIKALSQYVEDWLVGYAKEHGYDGVVMGGHSYNTSKNWSQHSGRTLGEDLIFDPRHTRIGFYSDILLWDIKTKTGMVQDGYWLWRKE